jgi:hypothetical protein
VYAAPPVRVSLGRGWAWPAFVGACVGAAAANAAAWCLLAGEIEPALPLALLCGLCAASIAAWQTHRSHGTGELRWDGASWQWQGSDGDAHVAIDLGRWMLLRFEPSDGARQWLAASRGRTDGPWPALRAALYSRRPSDAIDVPPA